MRRIILTGMMVYDIFMLIVLILALAGIGGNLTLKILAAMICGVIILTIAGTCSGFFDRHGIIARPWWRKVSQD